MLICLLHIVMELSLSLIGRPIESIYSTSPISNVIMFYVHAPSHAYVLQICQPASRVARDIRHLKTDHDL
jgi:hypothetical protein